MREEQSVSQQRAKAFAEKLSAFRDSLDAAERTMLDRLIGLDEADAAGDVQGYILTMSLPAASVASAATSTSPPVKASEAQVPGAIRG